MVQYQEEILVMRYRAEIFIRNAQLLPERKRGDFGLVSNNRVLDSMERILRTLLSQDPQYLGTVRVFGYKIQLLCLLEFVAGEFQIAKFCKFSVSLVSFQKPAKGDGDAHEDGTTPKVLHIQRLFPWLQV